MRWVVSLRAAAVVLGGAVLLVGLVGFNVLRGPGPSISPVDFALGLARIAESGVDILAEPVTGHRLSTTLRGALSGQVERPRQRP